MHTYIIFCFNRINMINLGAMIMFLGDIMYRKSSNICLDQKRDHQSINGIINGYFFVLQDNKSTGRCKISIFYGRTPGVTKPVINQGQVGQSGSDQVDVTTHKQTGF